MQGYFDIVSLSGVYLLSKSNGLSTLKGGFSISLVGHDGSLFGGGLAGPLIAASPVQVTIFHLDQHASKRPTKIFIPYTSFSFHSTFLCLLK